MTRRVGVLGGTFDPVHIGHQVAAQDVVEALELDRLLVVPAGRPPHRDASLPAADRFELTARAFRGDPRIEVSELELRRSGPSYTVDTLAEVREALEPDRLFCVFGVDQLRELDTWCQPRRIAELADLAVMSRAGEAPGPGDAPLDLEFRPVPVTCVEVSSTRIRDRLRRGRSVRYLVPETVREGLEAAWSALPDEERTVRG